MSLSDILDAREARWMQKCAYAKDEKRCVVSLTLRMPIELRQTEEAKSALFRGREEVHMHLKNAFDAVSFKGGFLSADGPYALFTVLGNSEAVKRMLVRFEEESLFGDLLDADVMDETGREISRASVGGSARKCLVCNRTDARLCAKSHTHTREFTVKTIQEVLKQKLCKGTKNMLWMIASDIHGSNYYAEMLIKRFNEKKADKLILLGDLLYHGPRNDLPKDYAPKKVAALLNAYADKILTVRGNCEAEVDQMMLDFPALGDYAYLYLGGATVYASHGHHASEAAPPPIRNNEILLCGHTHIPKCAPHDGFIYMNPGSVSIPKEGSCPSFMTFENGVFRWINLETDEVYMEYCV